MIDPGAFARLLCDWCLEPQPGQQVLVASSTLAIPLVRALNGEILERGAWPVLRLSFPEQMAEFFAHARDKQLDAVAPLELLEARSIDVVVSVDAPGELPALAHVDPQQIMRAMRAREPIQRARRTKRWCNTQWPTPALARRAGMTEESYAAFLGHALFLDQADPVAAWRALSDRQSALVQRLAGVSQLRIEAQGTDLSLRVEGRTWINSDGKRNMPSGEIFTGPHEDSASGTIRFTIASHRRGVEVSGVELTFEDGEVVAARASEGDAYLQAALATDPGARRVGELGIGTNTGIDRATGSTLLDEKIGGTVHLALGRSYPETGGLNASALHWDLVCDLRDGGRLTADGETVSIS